jgi:hypothetical protein
MLIVIMVSIILLSLMSFHGTRKFPTTAWMECFLFQQVQSQKSVQSSPLSGTTKAVDITLQVTVQAATCNRNTRKKIQCGDAFAQPKMRECRLVLLARRFPTNHTTLLPLHQSDRSKVSEGRIFLFLVVVPCTYFDMLSFIV